MEQVNTVVNDVELHDNRDLRIQKMFSTSPAKRAIWELLPDDFSWSEAEDITNPVTGKPVNRDTLNRTLRLAESNAFLSQDLTTMRYKKLLRAA